ncbi:XrtA/PEP-CTERM system TPR-repeat protein PrsT [Paucibacter sp. XJ19-41]|uniref:XrtA/PEP-CTERM system TPR-repeat protein PrsT n=1 Tax=Paucibacter sp. XJ19-41 TaxID=2927824 RepID=UPI00234A3567|nr:XrtA/PEP-CTERM system TPR-repeat protein PrsT [Paucibacter sp. XJ19-41]MDC6166081.1 PEP-CTERM system TPR-repeat protein PrsT [Paucibacter sp. XJ19-41]
MAAPHHPLIAAVVGTMLLLGGCSEPTAQEQLSIARTSLEKKNLQAAIIELKLALQKQPDLAEARFLLGKALLDTGDANSASFELRKALDQGYPKETVIPALAKAMLLSQQAPKLLADFAIERLDDAKALAELKTTIASAHALLGETEKAQAATEAALLATPDFPPALILQAGLASSKGAHDQALALIELAIATDPKNVQAWMQKGDILRSRGDFAGAAQAMTQALSLDPASLPARAGLFSIAMQQRDVKTATQHATELRAKHPGHPQTLMAEAQLALTQKQLESARDKIAQVLKVMPDNPQALQLAGIIQFNSGALLESERSLSKALSLQPDLRIARKQLAQTQIRMGQPDKALSTLQPLIVRGDAGADIYALAGEAYVLSGTPEQASKSFAEAVKLDPENPNNKTMLALARQGSVGINATITELRRIATADKGTYADLTLITLLLREGQFDTALKAIDRLQAKQEPGSAVADNLRGRVNLARNDVAAARSSFEKALSLDPVYLPAVTSLATLDLQANKPADAKKRFDAMLAADPQNLAALLGQTKIRILEKAPASEITSMLGAAIKLNPQAAEPRLLLVELQLQNKEHKGALETAQSAITALPGNADLLDALGRAQQAAGEKLQALASFKKLAGLEPRSTRALVRTAGVHLAAKDSAAAEQSLRQALEMYPNYLPVQRMLITVALTDKRPQDALRVAKTVQQQRPKEVVGYEMEATIEASRNNTEAMIASYRRALQQIPRTDIATRLHAAQMTAGQTKDADETAARWLANSPQDIAFMAYLGDLAMTRGEYEKAEKQFRQVLSRQANNTAALNNVAWTMAQQKKPGAAEFAERALKLAPDTPGLMDTLATALAAEGRVERALELQRKALSLAPEQQVLRLNLAKLLLQAGNKPAAMAELKTLEKLGDKFPAHTEVDRLLKTI